jgi:hypothetical protein
MVVFALHARFFEIFTTGTAVVHATCVLRRLARRWCRKSRCLRDIQVRRKRAVAKNVDMMDLV